MVKCLIRIKTKVNVHLRMINHCYRDVKVRVLTMGPRLLGNVLGALPITPSLQDSSGSSGMSISPYGRTSRAAESLHDSGVSTLVHSSSASQSDLLASSLCDASAREDSVEPSDQSNVLKIHGRNKHRSESSRSDGVASKTTGKATEPAGARVMRSVAWMVLAMFALLSALLLLLLALTESELDVGLLEDVREHREYQALHYTYFCPLRRWLACTLRWLGGHLIKE